MWFPYSMAAPSTGTDKLLPGQLAGVPGSKAVTVVAYDRQCTDPPSLKRKKITLHPSIVMGQRSREVHRTGDTVGTIFGNAPKVEGMGVCEVPAPTPTHVVTVQSVAVTITLSTCRPCRPVVWGLVLFVSLGLRVLFF